MLTGFFTAAELKKCKKKRKVIAPTVLQFTTLSFLKLKHFIA